MEGKEFGTFQLFDFDRRKKPYQKWTYYQKKNLIDNRIKYDYMFFGKYGYNRGNTQDIWRIIMKASNLEHLEVHAVQIKWQNFMTKYRSIVNGYLSSDGTLSKERVEELSEKWEFFRTIHNFMISERTYTKENLECNLKNINNNSPLADHAYGKILPEKEQHSNISVNSNELMSKDLPKSTQIEGSQQKYKIQVRKLSDLKMLDRNVELSNVKLQPTGSSISESEKCIPFVSKALHFNKSTSDNKIVTPIAISKSKSSFLPPIGGIESKPQSMEIYPVSIEPSTTRNMNMKQKTEKIYNDNISQTVSSLPSLPPQPSSSSSSLFSAKASSSTKSADDDKTTKKRKHSKHHDCNKHYRRTYEEKLYKHTKRTTRRIERRMDALLNVFAQIVKQEHPNVNVDKILKK